MDKQNAQHALVKFLSETENAGYLLEVLQILLTYDEFEQVLTRLQIIKALLDGSESQRDIAEQLGVSIAKITRGSNMLKVIDPALKTFLQKTLLPGSGK